jgi:hypothetical protein
VAQVKNAHVTPARSKNRSAPTQPQPEIAKTPVANTPQTRVVTRLQPGSARAASAARHPVNGTNVRINTVRASQPGRHHTVTIPARRNQTAPPNASLSPADDGNRKAAATPG